MAKERTDEQVTVELGAALPPASATPSHEEIARMAYSIWEGRGGVGGSADEDWFEAEALLRSR
jgi:hypothetical protein